MHSFRIFIAVIAVLIAGSMINRAFADEKSASICYTTWGIYGGDGLPGKGIIPDLTTRVLENAGYRVTVDIVPWPRCVALTKSHKYDLIASAWRGKNFDADFDYFDITWENDISFVVTTKSPLKSGELAALSGKTVGHVRDSGGMDAVRNNPAIRTQEVAVMDALVRMLVGGRIDAVLSDPPSLFAAAAKMDPPLANQLQVLSPPLMTNYNSPLVAKGHPKKEELRQAFGKSFKDLIAKGLYDDMIKTHGEQLRFDVPKEHR